MTREAALASEEAVIAAAAGEAIALAKAAVKFAKAAAQLLQSSHSLTFDKPNEHSSGDDILRSEFVQQFEFEKIDRSIRTAETIRQEGSFTQNQSEQTLISNVDVGELDVQEKVTVRSTRTERRVRRGKMEEKDAAGVVSAKLGLNGKKKRAGFHEVDYSDPLRYFRGMTSTAKLLTASEEQQLSKGIQVKYTYLLE